MCDSIWLQKFPKVGLKGRSDSMTGKILKVDFFGFPCMGLRQKLCISCSEAISTSYERMIEQAIASVNIETLRKVCEIINSRINNIVILSSGHIEKHSR